MLYNSNIFETEKKKTLFRHQISAILTDFIEKSLKITSRDKILSLDATLKDKRGTKVEKIRDITFSDLVFASIMYISISWLYR